MDDTFEGDDLGTTRYDGNEDGVGQRARNQGQAVDSGGLIRAEKRGRMGIAYISE